MPDIDVIRGQLKALLSQPQQAPLFHYHNRFLGPRDKAYDPDAVSDRSAKSIVNDHAMIDPVEIVELKGYVELYRAHDGGRSRTTEGPLAKGRPVPKSAQTLGRYWWDRPTMQAMWDAVALREKDAEKRKTLFFGFLRAGNFVLPEWNAMTQIVCMAVPSGSSVVWRADGDPGRRCRRRQARRA